MHGSVVEHDFRVRNEGSSTLKIVKIEHPKERFTTALETVQPGQRYKLTLTIKPDGPGGRKTEPITVSTSSKAEPVLEIAANTFLHERVYTFPDSVDLGAIPISQLRTEPGLHSMLAPSLMV